MPELGDRIVAIAIVVGAAGALFEWLLLDTCLKYVDVLGFYQAQGVVDPNAGGDGPGLLVSGLHLEGRTLLPFLAGNGNFSAMWHVAGSILESGHTRTFAQGRIIHDGQTICRRHRGHGPCGRSAGFR